MTFGVKERSLVIGQGDGGTYDFWNRNHIRSFTSRNPSFSWLEHWTGGSLKKECVETDETLEVDVFHKK